MFLVSYLVGLVDIVTVQGAEQMLQTGHVVVIYGMNDGLHHKGVFFILKGEGRPLFYCSQKDVTL